VNDATTAGRVFGLKAVAAAEEDYDDTDDASDDTVELPLTPASADVNWPLLSRHDNNDVDSDIDYVRTGANELATNHSKNGVLLNQLSYTDNSSSNRNSNDVLPVARQPAIALQKNTHDVTTLQPALLSSSWHLLTAGSQQLNHAIVSEKRRLAAQRERLRKLRSVTDEFVVCNFA